MDNYEKALEQLQILMEAKIINKLDEFIEDTRENFIYLNKKINQIMAKQDQINASLAELNDASNSIAARIQSLIDSQNPGDPVSQESLDQLQSIADNLKAMGQDPNNPIPPVEPTV